MAKKTARSSHIGAEIKSAREAAGISLRGLAEKLNVQPGTLSRWENGERNLKSRDITKYLQAVGATSEKITALVAIAQEPEYAPELYVTGGSDKDQKLATLLQLERTASRITIVSPLLVPGLLQVREYMRAMMINAGVPQERIETRIAIRLGRKETISKAAPAGLKVILSENVLEQNIGGPEVMVVQLRNLLEVSQKPNVTLQIIPTQIGWHPGMDGLFTLMEFSDRTPIVRTENRRSTLFFYDVLDIGDYQQAVENVLSVAMSPASSAELIVKRIKKLEQFRDRV